MRAAVASYRRYVHVKIRTRKVETLGAAVVSYRRYVHIKVRTRKVETLRAAVASYCLSVAK